MADPSSAFQFEDVPLDQARMISRGPRMEPMLYDTLRQKILSLSTEATRIHLGPEIRPQRMKKYLLRIAAELGSPSPSSACPTASFSGAPAIKPSSRRRRPPADCRAGGSKRRPSDDPKPAPEDAGGGRRIAGHPGWIDILPQLMYIRI
jgi:hypothetical protein